MEGGCVTGGVTGGLGLHAAAARRIANVAARRHAARSPLRNVRSVIENPLDHEIARAIRNAAAAANPPINTVWRELRTGDAPVKCPFTYPKIASASSVMLTEAGRAM